MLQGLIFIIKNYMKYDVTKVFFILDKKPKTLLKSVKKVKT